MTYKHADNYDSIFWAVLDLVRGINLNHCIWANDETGEYEEYSTDDRDRIIRDYDNQTGCKTEIKKGKIILYKPWRPNNS